MYSKPIKICPGCNAPKDPQKDYYQRKDKQGNPYPGSHCKLCTKNKLRKWAADNPDRAKKMQRRAWKSAAGLESKRKYHQRLRLECIKKLGSKCAWHGCDWTDVRVLQIDHVHSNGNRERKELKGNQTALYRKVMSDESGAYQLLCANHNWIKRHEMEEDKSQRKKTTDFIE